jgi:hypothetical protein
MISYAAYRVLHLVGVVLLFTAFGGMLATAGTGRNKLAAMFHGIGLVVLLLTGFGLMSRLGISHTALPLWIWAKLAIWLLLGGIVVMIRKTAGPRTLLWLLIPTLGVFAAYLCIYKPF